MTALIGPRQSGKTTLARQVASEIGGATFFDLEDLRDLARFENPYLTLEPLRGLVILDEIQFKPDLFTVLRVLVDQPVDRQFLVLGSASGELLRQTSETLAGRVNFIEVTPFCLDEVGPPLETLWERGGFPRSYTAETLQESEEWRHNFINTYLQHDLADVGIKQTGVALRRFWTMIAHHHGGILNATDLGTALGVTDATARRYVDAMADTFMIRLLPPWFANLGKRQVKRPKVYVRDTGLLHALLGFAGENAYLSNPRLGFSWEGFALEQVLRKLDVRPGDAYFWGVPQQAELDLVIQRNGRLHGFEFKYSDVVKKTRSMQNAVDMLDLESLTVVVPKGARFELGERIRVSSLELVG
ncbi:MAG TPA: ATP-binding protein [Fimbriimonadaceae bacterium]|nr:ATP-binding protein [Fimbriimonadaceae bacterium]